MKLESFIVLVLIVSSTGLVASYCHLQGLLSTSPVARVPEYAFLEGLPQNSESREHFEPPINDPRDLFDGTEDVSLPSREQIHPLTKTLFITPHDVHVSRAVMAVTGGWENDSSIEEIWYDLRLMYTWVHTMIEYRNDTFPSMDSSQIDVWQFPNQTLWYGSGDCEDKAILLASMIRNYCHNIYYVECLLLRSSQGIGHVIVYLPIQRDQICILDPTIGYSTTGETVSHPLSSRLLEQEVADYLAFLSEGNAGMWIVTGVFSSYFHKDFLSTTEAIHWLIERIP